MIKIMKRLRLLYQLRLIIKIIVIIIITRRREDIPTITTSTTIAPIMIITYNVFYLANQISFMVSTYMVRDYSSLIYTDST